MPYFAPNGLNNTVDAWRSKTRFLAFGLICASEHKRVSNRAMARALGMDSRGLRQVLERDPHFIVQLLGERRRTEPWYSINPAHPPLLLDENPAPEYVARTIVGGEQVRLGKD